MTFSKERHRFKERLRAALLDKNLPTSPSSLARLIGAYAPSEAISVIGVRKWIVGDSIPSPSKMEVLAEITGVSSAWLRYGDGHRVAFCDTTNPPSLEELRWAVDLSYLTQSEIALVTALVKELLDLQEPSDDTYKITMDE